jgi:exodeoxyribonuclease VII large subunit
VDLPLRFAPTGVRRPSAAAELVSPDQQEWLRQVRQLERRLARNMESAGRSSSVCAGCCSAATASPGQLLRQQSQRLDDLEQRSRLALRSCFSKLQSVVRHAHATLLQHTPRHRIERARLQQDALERRLRTTMHALLKERQRRFAVACKSLDTISPLATLSAVMRLNRAGEGDLRKATEAATGEQIEACSLRFAVVHRG